MGRGGCWSGCGTNLPWLPQGFSVINYVSLGFPIAVAVYLLVRIENRLDGLSASIGELARAVGEMREEI